MTPLRTLVLILLASGAAITAQVSGTEPLQQTLAEVARNAPDTYAVDAAGMSRSGRRLWSLEPKVPLDSARRRVVILGGLDGSPESAAAVVDVLKWYFTLPALAAFREGWQVAAVPCVYVDRCGGGGVPTATDTGPAPAFPPADGYYNAERDPESRFIWRWVAMQSPDLVVDLVDRRCRRVQHGVTRDSDGEDGHSPRISTGEPVGSRSWIRTTSVN